MKKNNQTENGQSDSEFVQDLEVLRSTRKSIRLCDRLCVV